MAVDEPVIRNTRGSNGGPWASSERRRSGDLLEHDSFIECSIEAGIGMSLTASLARLALTRLTSDSPWTPGPPGPLGSLDGCPPQETALPRASSPTH